LGSFAASCFTEASISARHVFPEKPLLNPTSDLPFVPLLLVLLELLQPVSVTPKTMTAATKMTPIFFADNFMNNPPYFIYQNTLDTSTEAFQWCNEH
jgi:hypothetical protein